MSSCAPGCGPRPPRAGWTGGTSPSTARPCAARPGPTAPPAPAVRLRRQRRHRPGPGRGRRQDQRDHLLRPAAAGHPRRPRSRPRQRRQRRTAAGTAAAAAAAEEEEESGDQELVIVTADAMHTQAGHVEAMNALGVAWILTLKDNQPGLYAAADAWNWEDEPVLHATSEISRSRHEVRTIRVTSQIPDLIRERLPSTHSSRSSSGTVTPSAAGRPRTPAAPPETRPPSPARSHTARNCPARPSWPSPRSPPARRLRLPPRTQPRPLGHRERPAPPPRRHPRRRRLPAPRRPVLAAVRRPRQPHRQRPQRPATATTPPPGAIGLGPHGLRALKLLGL